MSYKHFNMYERGKIEVLHRIGYSSRKIAKEIGRHHSSIARELNRFREVEYRAEKAHMAYIKRRKSCRWKGRWNEELGERIAQKLKLSWSPEQISNTVALGKASFKTIYNWLYKGIIDGVSLEVLRRKGKKRSCKNLAFYSRGVSIRKRPKEVHSREIFGHWELDTIVSGAGKNGCLATFVERKTRLYTAIKISNRTSASMENAIKYLVNLLPKNAFLTATSDRGGEFACFPAIKKDLDLTIYFADPYCPHQRGSNEYSNGLLREFYPKGSDLSEIPQQELTHNLFLINNRPRKCLNWLSPIHAFLHELSHLT